MRENPAREREDWLAELHGRHAGAVYAYARRRVDTPEDAEDVVVEVFTTAWRRRADLPEAELPWLYATAAHVIAHVIRGDARRRRLGARLAVVRPVATATDDPADRIVAVAAARERVAAALADLPAADAELLRLWAWEHLEPAQIAEVLGCTAGTARTRLHRARNRLRESLHSQDMSGPWDVAPETASPQTAAMRPRPDRRNDGHR